MKRILGDRWLTHVAGAAGLCSALLLPQFAQAQQGADFYKGKTVTYIVATKAGGGYDFYGRLAAEYMQKYLPGSTFIVKNMPGAGHLIGANAIYASKADGLTIGSFNTGLIYSQLIQLPAMRADLTKMSWVGKASSDPRVFVIAKQSPIKTFEDFRKQTKPINFATAGVGSAAYVETLILARAMNLPIKLLTGYNGNEDQLAMRRGEIVGTGGSRSSMADFVKNGYGHFIAQIGGKEKDVPQLDTFTTDPKAKALIALVKSQGEISRLTVGPPGIPADRLAALRAAFKSGMEDKTAQAKVEKLGRPLDPAYGVEVEKMVKEALQQSPETIALLKASMKKKKKK